MTSAAIPSPTAPRVLLAALGAALALHAVLLAALVPALARAGDPAWSPSEPLPAIVVVPEAQPQDAVQVVSLPAPDREQSPAVARFADRFARSVERETVNRDDVVVPRAAPDRPQSSSSSGPSGGVVAVAVPSAAPVASSVSDVRLPGALRPADPRPGSAERAPVETAPETTPEAAPGAGPGAATGDASVRRPLVALAEFDAMNPASAAAVRRNDHLELEEGDRTMLNAYRSSYWSFFNRVQTQVSAEWEPNAVLRMNDPTGERFGAQDRYTVLSVTLNADGSLRHALVRRSSSLDVLDAEAVRAIEAAAPFANVPAGLVNEQGQATFTFGFFLDAGGRSRIRRMN